MKSIKIIFFLRKCLYILHLSIEKILYFYKKKINKIEKKNASCRGKIQKNEMNMVHCNIGNMIWNSAVYFKLSKKYW